MAKCKISHRGKAAHEWNDRIKDRIYCYGQNDASTEELLPECRACADNVIYAQQDADEWGKRGDTK